MTEFVNLEYGNEEGTLIRAYRDDGSILCIEPVMGELWENAERGVLGEVQPHTEPVVTEAQRLAKWRSSASVSRSQFILNCLDAGILSETDAEEAVNGWPAGWDTFFEGLPTRTRIEAKAEWASVTKVRRNAPLIAQLASHAGISDEQVDALFEGAT